MAPQCLRSDVPGTVSKFTNQIKAFLSECEILRPYSKMIVR